MAWYDDTRNVNDYINVLAERVSDMYDATSPTAFNGANRFLYFVPKTPDDVSDIFDALKKVGLEPQVHKSSLSDVRVVRVAYTSDKVAGRIHTIWYAVKQAIARRADAELAAAQGRKLKNEKSKIRGIWDAIKQKLY